jgi:hypothetical protein
MITQLFFQSWLPFIYLYGVGGLFFFTGIYIILKSGAVKLTKRQHKFWIKILFGGFFFFMFFHACLIIAALYL